MIGVGSWVMGTLGLTVVLLTSILISRARPFPHLPGARHGPLVVVGLLAVLIQAGHFVEELLTGFPTAFPMALGLPQWNEAWFTAFNVSWLAIWLFSLREAPRGRRLAEWPLWFLGFAMTLNGVAHPALALRAGGYFPGLWTSIPELLAGLLLLRELGLLTRPESPPTS